MHVIDSLCNSHPESLEQVKRLSNSNLDFTQCDIRDSEALDRAFIMFQPDIVIHFAGLKAVGESVANPALYHNVNVNGTQVLLGAMERVNCENIVFSLQQLFMEHRSICPVMKTIPLTRSTRTEGLSSWLRSCFEIGLKHHRKDVQ